MPPPDPLLPYAGPTTPAATSPPVTRLEDPNGVTFLGSPAPLPSALLRVATTLLTAIFLATFALPHLIERWDQSLGYPLAILVSLLALYLDLDACARNLLACWTPERLRVTPTHLLVISAGPWGVRRHRIPRPSARITVQRTLSVTTPDPARLVIHHPNLIPLPRYRKTFLFSGSPHDDLSQIAIEIATPPPPDPSPCLPAHPV